MQAGQHTCKQLASQHSPWSVKGIPFKSPYIRSAPTSPSRTLARTNAASNAAAARTSARTATCMAPQARKVHTTTTTQPDVTDLTAHCQPCHSVLSPCFLLLSPLPSECAHSACLDRRTHGGGGSSSDDEHSSLPQRSAADCNECAHATLCSSLCTHIVSECARASVDPQTLAVDLFRGPVVMTLFLGLWAINVIMFQRNRIPYSQVLAMGAGQGLAMVLLV
jgi:hypothetical protein